MSGEKDRKNFNGWWRSKPKEPFDADLFARILNDKNYALDRIATRFRLTLIECMNELGWDQKMLAEKAQKKPSVVNGIMDHKRKNINIKTMIDLFWAMGKEIDIVARDRFPSKKENDTNAK